MFVRNRGGIYMLWRTRGDSTAVKSGTFQVPTLLANTFTFPLFFFLLASSKCLKRSRPIRVHNLLHVYSSSSNRRLITLHLISPLADF